MSISSNNCLGWITTRIGAYAGRTNWVPRGWFTSLGYPSDDEHPESRIFAYAMREKIVAEMAKAPGALDMNAHENELYARYQIFDAESYQEPVYKGVRIKMALKGQGGRPGMSGASLGIGGLMVRHPPRHYPMLWHATRPRETCNRLRGGHGE